MPPTEKSRLLEHNHEAYTYESKTQHNDHFKQPDNQSFKTAIKHSIKSHQSEEEQRYKPFIESIVHGGLDGAITTFAMVTSVAGADLSPLVVVVLGVAHLVADGLSMGTGDAISTQAEVDLNKSERRRERREMRQDLHGEMIEIIDIYMQKGMKRDDAETIVHTLLKYPDKHPVEFVDAITSEQLGMSTYNHLIEISPTKSGLVTMTSFMIFGSVPLLPYLIALIPGLSHILTSDVQLWSAVTMTIITLFILGILKGKVSVVKNIWWSGIQMAANGILAAVFGYVFADLLGKAVHADEQVPPGSH